MSHQCNSDRVSSETFVLPVQHEAPWEVTPKFYSGNAGKNPLSYTIDPLDAAFLVLPTKPVGFLSG